jgi:hypothetical protein
MSARSVDGEWTDERRTFLAHRRWHHERPKTRLIGAGQPDRAARWITNTVVWVADSRVRSFMMIHDTQHWLATRFGRTAPVISLRRSFRVRGLSLASCTHLFHLIHRDQNQQSQQPQSPNRPNGPTAYANGPGSVLPRGEYAANGSDVEMRTSMFG